ncbi:unnamed protein product [Phytophthora fragariaefolia]|uniref:Unnamed protein product n=1 Tax=Phytophthora fragariaefolia TaxID=1490495 RepID=A0A9W6XIT6_9STRA|nr:unnamed protein product [Phytophthora fragariaefolia]
MTVGQRIAFDEGMIPMRSKYNPMWQAEIYQGRLNSDYADLNQVPNDVIRNVEEILSGLPKRRLIITDQFYSSVLLSSILLQRGLYLVDTIQTNRRGMIAVSWMDNRLVHFITTGCNTRPATLSRRAGADAVDVPAPQLVKDYQDGMGGVSGLLQSYVLRIFHDYSTDKQLLLCILQHTMEIRKYYRTIFIRLVDMALINVYIIHRRVQGERAAEKAPLAHAEFMRLMQTALLGVDAADLEGGLSVRALVDTPVPPSPTPRYTLLGRHTTKQVDLYRSELHWEATCSEPVEVLMTPVIATAAQAQVLGHVVHEVRRVSAVFVVMSGNRSKADVVAAVSRDIDFGHFWRQLRARGWKYRRPKGIETKGSYVNADGSKVLVGEEAVVAYALESGLLDANENSADEVSGALDQASGAMHQVNASVGDVSAAVGDVSAAVDPVTATVDQVGAGVGGASAAVDQVTDTIDQVGAGVGLVSMSQIDTRVMLSQRTMNEIWDLKQQFWSGAWTESGY